MSRNSRNWHTELTRASVRPTRLSIRIWFSHSCRSIARRPGRTLFTALGTVLGVGATIATIGIGQSANGAVSSVFDALRSTQVTFVASPARSGGPVLKENSEGALRRLHGVVAAGLMGDVNGSQPIQVRRALRPDPTGVNSLQLPVTVASPGALQTIQAHLSSGRLYNNKDEAGGLPVILLGSAAASQLGIANTADGPAVFIGAGAFTVIGVVDQVSQQSEALLSVIIPPGITSDITAATTTDRMVVQTSPGAAQIIGAQGPYALSPGNPGLITAETPPDPKSLRASVETSVKNVLLLLAGVSLLIGVAAIANTTLLSLIQRQSEFGLRRAVGARPIHIAVLVLGEAAIVGTVGGVIGASAGVLAVVGTAIGSGWTPVLSWQVLVAAPLIGTMAGVLAGVYPAVRVTRVAPSVALQR